MSETMIAQHSSLESCSCDKCVAACSRKPGWMKPGEAERIADFLKISLEQLFEHQLCVDFWRDSPDVFVLMPAIVGSPTGGVLPEYTMGRCVFLDEGRCRIHAVKPFECAQALLCGKSVPLENSGHFYAADAWRPEEHQRQIGQLLGHMPYVPREASW